MVYTVRIRCTQAPARLCSRSGAAKDAVGGEIGLERVGYYFADRTGVEEPKKPELIPALTIPKEAIDEEIDRLASLPRPANGRRSSRIANPLAGAGEGLAPGIDVSISVLKPGERTTQIRHNSSQVNFSIRGGGESIVDGKTIRYGQYEVFNTPSWVVYEHRNNSNDLQVRLTYSNAPLLEKMKVHIIEDDPKPSSSKKDYSANDHQSGSESPFGTFLISDDGAYLMPYEKLINPDVLKYSPLYFPWERVKAELSNLAALGQSYRGRRLYLLYNPATGRTNGTTSNFFATFTIRPKNIVDRPHRHVGAAINYYFAGSGYSVVEGTKYPWKAGDLMLSAPGWAVHHHASLDEDVYELTIQDSPLNIWMGSLLWQESLDQPIESLGASEGFTTNRKN
jgi:gentisate 1,2-dioxygenase